MPWLMWFVGGLLCVLEMMFRNAPAVMTQQIMLYYDISSVQLGLLVSSYYYPYVLLQVPGGIILDMYGTRRVALFIASMSTCAFFLFGLGLNMWVATVSRLLLGLAASCAFITTLKIATQWFGPDRFAMMSGLTNMMLTIGGIVAGYPLAYMTKVLGWQKTCLTLSGIGLIWTLIVFFTIQDPIVQKSALDLSAFLHKFKRILKDKQLWRIGVISACLYLPFSAFAELWAVPYIASTYHLPITQAASISMLLYIGSAIGSLFLARLLKIFGSYASVLRTTALGIMCAFALMSALFPIPYIGIICLFLLLGIVSTGQMLVFAWAYDGAFENEQGMRLGFVNAVTMMAPLMIQPLLGFVLDFFWTGTFTADGAKLYTANAYNCAILLFPVFCTLAVLLLNQTDDHSTRTMERDKPV